MSAPVRAEEDGFLGIPPGIGFLVASLVISVGTFWAFERGAHDFKVFYSAWKMVLEGRGAEIYNRALTPDRFLYAPGFAWLLSPLALLPGQMVLALWCFAKAAVIGYLVREFRPRAYEQGVATGFAALGILLVVRPLLIDFQYGQVNILILGACAWALLGHFRRDSAGFLDLLRWLVLGVVAVAKVFPLPLLVVPYLVKKGIPEKRLRLERLGLFAGVALILLVPVLTQGWAGTWHLLSEWREALVSRGLPLESHNQSFAAFLHHYLTGEATHVVSHGMVPVVFGVPWLSGTAIMLLSLAWMVSAAGFLLMWITKGSQKAPLEWCAVLMALLILPSHLVWKPYFVMALPLAILALDRIKTRRRAYLLFFLFAVMNLSGFDFVGDAWGARFEAGALMLWAELGLIAFVCYGPQARS
ncbi:glycosyltransferase family 87 protein [Bdellovibrionota bacterium FG-1]